MIDGDHDEFADPVWWSAAARLLDSKEGRQVVRIADAECALNVTSLPDTAKSFLVAALMERCKRRAVIFVPDEARARTMAHDGQFLYKNFDLSCTRLCAL